MAKYVFDFEMVNLYSCLAKSLGEEMKESLTNYENTINNDLSSWSGDAKNFFVNTNSNYTSVTKQNIENIIELSNFFFGLSVGIYCAPHQADKPCAKNSLYPTCK